jgi:hypothetical protein
MAHSNAHARIRFPQSVQTQVSSAFGTTVWLDGHEIVGVKSITIGPMTPGAATTITIELIVGGLEIEYDKPAFVASAAPGK